MGPPHADAEVELRDVMDAAASAATARIEVRVMRVSCGARV
jgi:hypothetical protein